MKHYLFLATSFFFLAAIQNLSAQCTTNALRNGSFELPAQSTLGNNFPSSVPNWTFLSGTPNVILVNGSNYFGGPNTANLGSQYLDINSAGGVIQQSFTLTCPSTITFRGAFSSREGGSNWVAVIEIVNSSNTVVATSGTRNFTPADADLNPPGADAIWHTVNGTTSLAAGTYFFRVPMDDFTNFDNAFLCASPGCLLPLRLLSFDVKGMDNCKSLLQWTTADEVNVDRFEVEYSYDGINFIKYNTVKAKNLPSVTDYSFVFPHQQNGVIYFRLKMIDNDLEYKYSGILKTRKDCVWLNKIGIQPSIATNFLNITVNATLTNNNLRVFNAKGQLIASFTVLQGLNQLDISKLSPGLYYVWQGSENKMAGKFIKAD